MDLNELKIGEVKELVQLLNLPEKQKSVQIEKDLGIRIVILQRGWIVVGHYKQSGDYVTLTKASVVRKWGATQGLPEIASNGPTSSTVLDKGPDMRFHILTEVFSIDCVAGKWIDKL